MFYHLSPLNISVHSTNPELRARMLGNPKGADILNQLGKLRGSGIELNFQIVLCKGLNDGAELRRSIEDLSRFMPDARSLSVVPAGLSAHREGLYPLELFSAEEAAGIIDVVEEYQNKFLAEFGTRFVYAADELYVSSGRGVPDGANYEDFPQIENGVGMLSLFTEEFNEGLLSLGVDRIEPRTVSVVTGRLCGPIMRELCGGLMKKVDGLNINVYDVGNDFFGPDITVAGLLAGRDIIRELAQKRDRLGGAVIIASSMLRSGEEVFLDDMTVAELSAELGVPVVVCETDGTVFIEKCVGGCVWQNR
jgi:putative radical SAM enzyme (TIGR03279 family)